MMGETNRTPKTAARQTPKIPKDSTPVGAGNDRARSRGRVNKKGSPRTAAASSASPNRARRGADNRENKLRRLNRRDLLELLEDLSRENDCLRAELEQANRKLEEREALMDNCGSIAEASLQLSGVFEAAERAAHIYVESCKRESAKLRQQTRGAQPDPGASDAGASGKQGNRA